MTTMGSQITSLTVVYSIVYSDADQRKHQSSASLAFVWGIHRWPVNSPHKGPVTRKMFPFDDVIMYSGKFALLSVWVNNALLDIPRLLVIYPDSKVHWANMGPTWGRQVTDKPFWYKKQTISTGDACNEWHPNRDVLASSCIAIALLTGHRVMARTALGIWVN